MRKTEGREKKKNNASVHQRESRPPAAIVFMSTSCMAPAEGAFKPAM